VKKGIKNFRPPVGEDFCENENGTAAERWLKRLSETGEVGQLALDALERLEVAGCERETLVWLLMWLHSTRRWNPVSRKTTQQALLHMKRLEPFLRALAMSDLREKLLLVEGPAEDGSGSFVVQLEMIREQLEVVACHATGRENQLFNNMMSLIVAYVQRQTGQFHDDNLSAIIKLMGDGKFNCEGWRKRHRSWTPRITALRAPSPKRRSTA
jgi:hypothetical protein